MLLIYLLYFKNLKLLFYLIFSIQFKSFILRMKSGINSFEKNFIFVDKIFKYLIIKINRDSNKYPIK